MSLAMEANDQPAGLAAASPLLPSACRCQGTLTLLRHLEHLQPPIGVLVEDELAAGVVFPEVVKRPDQVPIMSQGRPARQQDWTSRPGAADSVRPNGGEGFDGPHWAVARPQADGHEQQRDRGRHRQHHQRQQITHVLHPNQ